MTAVWTVGESLVLPPWDSLAGSFSLTFHIGYDRQAPGINISPLKHSHFPLTQLEPLVPDL